MYLKEAEINTGNLVGTIIFIIMMNGIINTAM